MPKRPQKKKPELTTAEDVPSLYIAEGGATVSVTFIGAPQPQDVQVKLLDIAGLGRFIELLDRDRELAAYVCDKPAEWAAKLHPLSVLTIKQKAMELNFTSAQMWAENNLAIMAANMETQERHGETAKKLQALQSTSTPSPAASPSS